MKQILEMEVISFLLRGGRRAWGVVESCPCSLGTVKLVPSDFSNPLFEKIFKAIDFARTHGGNMTLEGVKVADRSLDPDFLRYLAERPAVEEDAMRGVVRTILGV
jgi:hypothetical protein